MNEKLELARQIEACEENYIYLPIKSKEYRNNHEKTGYLQVKLYTLEIREKINQQRLHMPTKKW